MKLEGEALALFVMQRHQTLRDKLDYWLPLYQEIANYVMPRSRNMTSKVLAPNSDRDAQLFDNTAIRACMTLANGQMAWLTPKDSRWFAYDAPERFKGFDPVEQWYKTCTEIIALELARNSNFYFSLHEFYLDRSGFGTAVLHCEPGIDNLYRFKKFDVGTFAVAENYAGDVDTLSREFELTARQAVQEFGKENVSPEILKAFEEVTGNKREKCFTFVHQCFPREADQIEFGKRDEANMPIASVYVEKNTKKISRISGYPEQPFFCSRYLKWFESEPYGWSPAVIALPEARQLNFLEKQMDALAEVTAFPRILIPDGFKDEVDLRASGITYFNSADPNGVPREWLTQGKYDVGLDRAERKRKAINESFHVDLFRMFAEMEKQSQMTAREVIERASEKMNQFSPAADRLTGELYTPVLRRCFSIAYRAGRLPPVPRELIDPASGTMPMPEVAYSSRIALAIKALENASFGHVTEMWVPYSELRPDVLDNFDLDAIARDTSRNSGLPARWLVPVKVREKMREERAKKRAEMEKQAQMAQMAESAGKIGAIKQDSLVGQGLQGLLGGNRQGRS